ncbi:hypothetical protein BRD56_08470 [Thermoplasmatales archaeon SW_10_69_26]|nr:MAG: hypothetical protein BRD56_08470 [Thermoplasmatales archaeon SW_10_69_26]
MFLEPEDPGVDEEAVGSAVANPCDRQILALAQRGPVAAKTILERTSIPKSTLYRRIDRLQEQGLLEVVSSTIEDGHRIDRYRCPLQGIGIRIEDGEIHLEWSARRPQAEDA